MENMFERGLPMKDLLPQIVGFAAVLLFLLSYQLKKRGQIIFVNVTSRVLYILQYVLLHAYSGALLDVLGVISSTLAGKKDAGFIKKHTKAIFWIVNIGIIAAGGALAYINKSFLDLLPVAGVLLQICAFWSSSERTIRWVSLFSCPFWFAYNLIKCAYGSAVGDVLALCSIVIAMIRYREKEVKV